MVHSAGRGEVQRSVGKTTDCACPVEDMKGPSPAGEKEGSEGPRNVCFS